MAIGSCASGAVAAAAQGRAVPSGVNPGIVIVLSAEAEPAEQTASDELAHYLSQILGSPVEAISESQAAGIDAPCKIYVGPTQFARQNGIELEHLGPEEWLLQSAGTGLIVAGGRPRGTLYAAYHLLEDVLGVHWWNPFEESVPSRPGLQIPPLNLHGKPALQYRDIYMVYGHDGGRFAARNRLNRDGDSHISQKYGGSRDYGLPYHVHTFGSYIPGPRFFASHPEWFSLVDGKRIYENAQLCLTNEEMRQEFLTRLRANIAASEAAAHREHTPVPAVYSVSQNDCYNPCQCAKCQEIARSEESECGPLLHFVNFLADSIRHEYPNIFIDTLAYQYTQKAPKYVKPRDNVIVRLCNTDSDLTRPITAAVNTPFRQQLMLWSKIAKNLRIWNYAVTYASPIGMPMPTAQNYGADYQFYAAHHVEGVFTELEFEILADLRDLKVWIMAHQLEAPHKSYQTLLRTFTEGFYGPAARFIRQYLVELQEAARGADRQNHVQALGEVPTYGYLTPAFILRASHLFDAAEKAVANNAVFMRRVRHARLPLDRAIVHFGMRLSLQRRTNPQLPEIPPRMEVARRALDTWKTQARLRFVGADIESEIMRAEADLLRYAMPSDRSRLPQQFKDVSPDTLFDYTAPMSRNADGTVKVVKDPEAETGVADRLDLTASYVDNRARYALPMPWGLYGPAQKRFAGSSTIKPADIPRAGYHWYKMGTFSLEPSYYVYFFWSWIIQFDVDNALDPASPDAPCEIWARIKFTGPSFPHARAGETDAIYVERLVLIKR
jgi:Domain of unknown function (DUF4838)/Glycosyl hydrolase family 67 N-terminus